MITSVSNEKVKFVRSLGLKKNRQAHRRFVVEGVRAIEEAERAGFNPALVFFDPARTQSDSRADRLVAHLQAGSTTVQEVGPKVMAALSGTQTPQGVLAVYPFPDRNLPDNPRLALVLDSVRDPGNVGTIMRTAWAAGADAVLLTPDSADPYNPKVVRASMGAHFALAFAVQSWPEIRSLLSPIRKIYLAEARGEIDYRMADWTAPLGLIIGGEASGPGREAHAIATARLRIAMPGGAESLNAAVAAAVLLFEAVHAHPG